MSRWDEAERREIARLWNAGWSSNRLGRRFGVTRNVIIGFVARHGARYGCLDGRTRPNLPDPEQVKPEVVKRPSAGSGYTRLMFGGGRRKGPKAAPLRLMAEVLPDGPEPLTLMQRGPFMCCYPVGGEGIDTLYCCAPTVRSPHWQYCDTHLKLMGQAPESLRKPELDTPSMQSRRAA